MVSKQVEPEQCRASLTPSHPGRPSLSPYVPSRRPDGPSQQPCAPQVAVSLSDPFGGDDVDFPVSQYTQTMLDNAKALISRDAVYRPGTYLELPPDKAAVGHMAGGPLTLSSISDGKGLLQA